jgi:SPP1 gp7 family putative phage head morphogenesis protein
LLGARANLRTPSKTRERRERAKVLRSVQPNAGVQLDYKRRMDALIAQMHDSVLYWVRAAYRANEPHMAQDELPATALANAVQRLVRRWQKNFDEAAPKLADHFATAAAERSTDQLKRILKDGGFTVRFTMSAPVRDVLRAAITENVSLIKSIPQQYLKSVEGAVMRSVQTGRDLKSLTDELQQAYGVTRRRAAFIARDQNNKASSFIQRARQQELGLERAVWMHSNAGEVPRPTHVAMNGKEYDIRQGMYDKDVAKWVFPGELPNCRCSARPVIVGFA